MTAQAPSVGLIHAQVEAIPERSRRGKAVGIYSAGSWQGPQAVSHGERTYRVYQCDSPLDARVALRESVGLDAQAVLVTSLSDEQVGQDVLLRLAKRRLFALDEWSIIRSVFRAKEIDPRLTRLPWLAARILDALSADAPIIARGGFLDAGPVWGMLLSRELGLESVDLNGVLRWAGEPTGRQRFQDADPEFREAAEAWLVETCGPAARLALTCLASAPSNNPIALGIAAGVVFDPSVAQEMGRAIGRFEERFLAGNSPDARHLAVWAETAEQVVRSSGAVGSGAAGATCNEADEVLTEIGAGDAAYLSNVSPIGFEQRLAAYGRALQQVVARESWSDSERLRDTQRAVESHSCAESYTRRVERVRMATRLVRWVEETEGISAWASFAEAADYQLLEGGFADRARYSLRHRDGCPTLDTAFGALFTRTQRLRELQANQFVRLLQGWHGAPSASQDVLPVESILGEVVAPLAKTRPVLVIVLDGMSAAVASELVDDLVLRNWTPLTESGRAAPRTGVATIPSKTECSRTSLLCGELRTGGAADETREFAKHAGLVAACQSGPPPTLFHKAELRRPSAIDLVDEVADAVANRRRRVVGVVVNAIDDNLSKGDQLDTRWTRDAIAVLPALMQGAAEAGRLVVLLSDHGHILDCGTESLESDLGQRIRSADRPPADGEVLVSGPRVLPAGETFVAAVSETIHYRGGSHGYHGGLNPQEMIAPVVVLSPDAEAPEGWTPRTAMSPGWWESPLIRAERPGPPPRPEPPAPKDMLFEIHEPEAPEDLGAGEHGGSASPAWVAGLIASEAFRAQKRLGGRNLPDDDRVSELLCLLDAQGGRMTMAALAREMDYPPLRLPGLLARVERILNIEGYDVIYRDVASGTVELDRTLLLQQFEIESDA